MADAIQRFPCALLCLSLVNLAKNAQAQFGATLPSASSSLAQVASPLGGLGSLNAAGMAQSSLAADRPWDAPSTAQLPGQAQPQAFGQQGMPSWGATQEPLVIGNMQFSREDDIENMEKLSNLFGQVFYTTIMDPGQPNVLQAWRDLSADIWALVDYAKQIPALALSVSMCLYNYFWWEGPHNADINVRAGTAAAELMYGAVNHARCADRYLPPADFFIQQCHLRWRYLFMLAGEVGRFAVTHRRDVAVGAQLLQQLRRYFEEFRQLPYSGLPHGINPHEVNFNADYFPAAVARQGPVWKNPLRDVPIASFLESHYVTIRGELESILRAGDTFRNLDEQTRNAETQFGPRGDDWLTAYMFRSARAIESVCAHAPQTCALLSSRPEIAECNMGGSGAGFLRMRPGGRLKPHFGNAPRLSVHLGLIVPDGEISMSVGYEKVKWEEGKVIVFDDTYIHQVTHNGNEPRYVLNVWMCHPCDSSNRRDPVPSYCEGAVGAMTQLGLMPLPPKAS